MNPLEPTGERAAAMPAHRYRGPDEQRRGDNNDDESTLRHVAAKITPCRLNAR